MTMTSRVPSRMSYRARRLNKLQSAAITRFCGPLCHEVISQADRHRQFSNEIIPCTLSTGRCPSNYPCETPKDFAIHQCAGDAGFSLRGPKELVDRNVRQVVIQCAQPLLTLLQLSIVGASIGGLMLPISTPWPLYHWKGVR